MIYEASILSVATGIVTNKFVFVPVISAILLAIFKNIPNEKIQSVIGGVFRKLGVAITLGLTKYKFTAPLWNSVIEPWFIDLVDNTVGTAVRSFIEGLRTDNE